MGVPAGSMLWFYGHIQDSFGVIRVGVQEEKEVADEEWQEVEDEGQEVEDEGNNDDRFSYEDVLRDVQQRQEEDVDLQATDQLDPSSSDKSAECEFCRQRHSAYDKQCEVATRLFNCTGSKPQLPVQADSIAFE